MDGWQHSIHFLCVSDIKKSVNVLNMWFNWMNSISIAWHFHFRIAVTVLIEWHKQPDTVARDNVLTIPTISINIVLTHLLFL